MSRQTKEQVNEAQRMRYAKRTEEAAKLKTARDFGIVGDSSVLHLSLRKIAAKRGVSCRLCEGCIVKAYIELVKE